MVRFTERFGAFSKKDDGGMTILGLYVTVAMFILGGLAVDVSSLISSRTQLQVAADLAAHAALYTREFKTADEARSTAIDLVEGSFPKAGFGNLLTAGDIQFGTYDRDTQTFTVDDSSTAAVYVKTARLSANSNSVTSFLMQFAGFAEWDVVTPSVFETYVPSCMRDGWIAEGVVDSQSNNTFGEGFCIHSNDHVEVNNNNFYDYFPGDEDRSVTVSMPVTADLIIPLPDGWDKNINLANILVPDEMNLRILNHLEDIRAGLYDPNSKHYRKYITDVTPVPLLTDRLTPSDFTEGRIHTYTCPGKKGITIDATTDVLQNIVLDTNCAIKFTNASMVENAVIYTTNIDDKSITSPQDLRLGAIDECEEDGAVQVVTHGGFEVASGLQIYSSQVIAKGPIQFAAQGDGVYGGSFISGQTIDGTSNTHMGSCPNLGDEVFTVDLFRMAG